SLDLNAIDRVGPVENDETLAIIACGLHGQSHRIYESVYTSSDILNVEHKRIEIYEHIRRWFASLSIKRKGRQARPLVPEGLPLDHVVLSLRPDSVLRSKHRGHTNSRMLPKQVRSMSKLAVYGCGIHDEADSAARDQIQTRFQDQ